MGFGLRQIGARENTARSRRRGDALEALSNKQTRVHGTLESHLRRARRGAVRLRGFDARILGLPLLVPRRPRRGFHPSGSPTRAAPSTRSDQSCLGKRKIRREFEPGNRFTISRQKGFVLLKKEGSRSSANLRSTWKVCAVLYSSLQGLTQRPPLTTVTSRSTARTFVGFPRAAPDFSRVTRASPNPRPPGPMAASLLAPRATVAPRHSVGRHVTGRKWAPARAATRVALRPWAAPKFGREAVRAFALSRDEEDSCDEDDENDIRCELDR